MYDSESIKSYTDQPTQKKKKKSDINFFSQDTFLKYWMDIIDLTYHFSWWQIVISNPYLKIT